MSNRAALGEDRAKRQNVFLFSASLPPCFRTHNWLFKNISRFLALTKCLCVRLCPSPCAGSRMQPLHSASPRPVHTCTALQVLMPFVPRCVSAANGERNPTRSKNSGLLISARPPARSPKYLSLLWPCRALPAQLSLGITRVLWAVF